MVSTPMLFDTNILIDYLSSCPQARVELDQYSDRAISIVTWMEIMAGATERDEAQLRTFLLNFHVVALSGEVAERAFQIRRTARIKLPDVIVQASAEVSGRILVTRNTRDFSPGTPGVRIPYNL